jgi:outer membrane protein TolC
MDWKALALISVSASGCVVGQIRSDLAELGHAAAAQPSPSQAEETNLGEETRLDVVLRLAMAHNPDLDETRERLRAALARVKASTRLPDLELKLEHWAVPLARPYALNQADTLMVGLRQQFPAPGTLRHRSRAAVEEAGMLLEADRARKLDLAAQVRRAYYDYYRADREYRIHLEHVSLATDVVELARANYRVGKGTQQDVLRVIVEMSKLHNDIAAIEQQRLTARVMLNTLMARAPDAPLGPPAAFQASDVRPRLEELERQLESARPELASAARAVRRSGAMLAAAKSGLYWPSFMVGADYWYLPTSPTTQHAWSAMVSFTLPWLNPRHYDEVSEAEHTLAADRKAFESVRNTAFYQLRDTAARLKAAQDSLAIIERDLLPQALQSFEASRAAFSSGQSDAISLLDAFRSYLDVRLQREHALARVQSSLADLDRAAGGSR